MKILIIRNTVSFNPFIYLLLLAGLLLAPDLSFSGDWRVAPIRLEFGKGAKTGAITVYNEGAEKLTVQMKAMEWTQDAEGKDQYAETSDIIFFPKIMVLEKNEEKIIRAGIRIPAVAKEKTYRLFIEEIPEPKKKEGANIAVAIRFGVPVFAKPLREEPRGEIEKIGMAKGVLSAVVRNIGNVHFRISSIAVTEKDAKGNIIFSKDLDGWYLLNGVSRTYTTEIPKDKCVEGSKLELNVKSDNLNITKSLNIEKSMCLP